MSPNCLSSHVRNGSAELLARFLQQVGWCKVRKMHFVLFMMRGLNHDVRP